MFSERFALHLARRVVVVIIQTDFAPRDHLRMLREFLQLRVKFVIKQSSFVRVNADRGVNEWIQISQAKRRGVRVGGGDT